MLKWLQKIKNNNDLELSSNCSNPQLIFVPPLSFINSGCFEFETMIAKLNGYWSKLTAIRRWKARITCTLSFVISRISIKDAHRRRRKPKVQFGSALKKSFSFFFFFLSNNTQFNGKGFFKKRSNFSLTVNFTCFSNKIQQTTFCSARKCNNIPMKIVWSSLWKREWRCKLRNSLTSGGKTRHKQNPILRQLKPWKVDFFTQFTCK